MVNTALPLVAGGWCCGFGFHRDTSADVSNAPCFSGAGNVAWDMDFTLLRDYQGQRVDSWLMSSKLDGWRLGWNGEDYVLRGGGILAVPDAWKAGMPDFILDGELWGGLGSLFEMQGRIKRGFVGLSFQVFDAPSALPFHKRLAYLKTLALPSHCELVEHVRCRGFEHMLEAADAEVAAGGEGIVLRNPRAPYVAGRSSEVLRWVPVDPAINRRRAA